MKNILEIISYYDMNGEWRRADVEHEMRASGVEGDWVEFALHRAFDGTGLDIKALCAVLGWSCTSKSDFGSVAVCHPKWGHDVTVRLR